MANNKPTPKNWNDVQVAIATASMVTTLACWNMFAGPDRASELEHAKEQATVDPAIVTSATPSPQVGKIFFGGAEPQQIVVVAQQSHNNGGGGNGGGGASGSGGSGVPVAPPGGGTGGS